MICILGCSAAGKTTCEKELEKRGYKRIISYTTRPIRANEIQDKDYHYVSDEKFLEMLNSGQLAENTNYRNWHYGIAKEDCLDDRIAVIEVFGYLMLKKNPNLNIKSFYLKVSERERMIRMAKRGDDINEIIRRLYADQGSFACIEDLVDFIIVNENRSVQETVDEIISKL
jgi:guanylate kinase